MNLFGKFVDFFGWFIVFWVKGNFFFYLEGDFVDCDMFCFVDLVRVGC